MSKMIIKKLISLFLTLFFVSLIIFFVFQVLPGNPAEIILGTEADEAQVLALKIELGLDKPILVRYANWIKDILKLNMGTSLKYQVPVKDLFF